MKHSLVARWDTLERPVSEERQLGVRTWRWTEGPPRRRRQPDPSLFATPAEGLKVRKLRLTRPSEIEIEART